MVELHLTCNKCAIFAPRNSHHIDGKALNNTINMMTKQDGVASLKSELIIYYLSGNRPLADNTKTTH